MLYTPLATRGLMTPARRLGMTSIYHCLELYAIVIGMNGIELILPAREINYTPRFLVGLIFQFLVGTWNFVWGEASSIMDWQWYSTVLSILAL